MPANKKTPPPAARSAGEDDAPSFENALERLETIVEELEGGTLSLEASLARYEEGVRLSRRLTQTLDQAEKRIERLVEENGEPTTRPVEDEPEDTRRPARSVEDEPADTRRPARSVERDEGELPF